MWRNIYENEFSACNFSIMNIVFVIEWCNCLKDLYYECFSLSQQCRDVKDNKVYIDLFLWKKKWVKIKAQIKILKINIYHMLRPLSLLRNQQLKHDRLYVVYKYIYFVLFWESISPNLENWFKPDMPYHESKIVVFKALFPKKKMYIY